MGHPEYRVCVFAIEPFKRGRIRPNIGGGTQATPQDDTGVCFVLKKT